MRGRTKQRIRISAPERSRLGALAYSRRHSGQNAVPMTRIRINFRFLLGSILLAGMVAGALYFVHSWQVRRLASALKSRATAFAAAEQWDRASETFHRYLQLRPDDGDARCELARCYDQTARSPHARVRAIDLYYQAIGAAPNDPSLRVRAAELLLETRRLAAAELQAKTALEQRPNDPTALRIIALARCQRLLSSKALLDDVTRAAVADAIEANPHDVSLVVTAAAALREAVGATPDDHAAADQLFDELIARDPNQAVSRLARYRYRLYYHHEEAAADLSEALRLDPNNPQVVLTAAEAAVRNRQFDEALNYCQRLEQQSAVSPVLYQVWGDAWLGKGNSDEALAAWRKGLQPQSPWSSALKLRMAEVMIRRGDAAGAAPVLDSLEGTLQGLANVSGQAAGAQVQLLRAKWHLLRGEWLPARRLLLRTALAPPAEGSAKLDARRRIEAWHLLANGEASRGQFDAAARHALRAVEVDPTDVQLRLAAARACTTAGQWNEALNQVEFTLRQSPDHVDALLLRAQLILAAQSRLPTAERDFEACDASLDRLKQLAADHPQLGMLQASRLLLSGDEAARRRAVPLLREAAGRLADEPQALGAIAFILEESGDQEGAKDATAALSKLTRAGDAVAALVEAELQLRRGDRNQARKLLLIAEPKLSIPQLERAAHLWTRLESLAGTPQKARDAWERHRKLAADAIFPLVLLAEVAIKQRDFATAEDLEEQLKEREGEDGPQWRYLRACRLLLRNQPADMHEVRKLVDWLTKQHPGWAKGWVALGMHAESRSDWDGAIDAYQRAVALPGEHLPVLERLVKLLYQQRRYNEVDRFIASLGARHPLSPEASLIAISCATAQQDLEQAMTLAKDAATRAPDHVPTHLWLAHLQQANGHLADAIATIEALADRLPGDARVWGGKLSLLQARGDRAAVMELARECQDNNALTELDRALLAAQAYEWLGYFPRAAQHYEQALRSSPRQSTLELRLAAVQMRYDPSLAEQTLRRLRERDPQSSAARRLLAVALASRRQPDAWPEIEALLNDESDGSDLRLAALLKLQVSPTDGVAGARQLFETLIAREGQPTDQDRQMLAALYEKEGNLAEAEKHYESLAARPTASYQQLATMTAFLLRRGDGEGALKWINRLEAKDGDAWVTTHLKALSLQAAKRDKALRDLLSGCEADLPGEAQKRERVSYRLQLAATYHALEHYDDAERHLLAAAQEEVETYPTLIHWLAQRQRPDDAMRAALEFLARSPSLAAVHSLTQVMANQPVSASLLAEGDRQLTALVSESTDAELLAAVADLRLVQHRRAEAIALYERILVLKPDDYVVLNNLAALLAESPNQRQRCLQLVETAIAQAPQPHPSLHDTRAKILLHQGRTEEAIAELEATLTRWPEADPRAYLHLALAYDQQGRGDDARQALAQARERGLQVADLTPGDRKLLEELDNRLASLRSPTPVENLP